MRVYADNDKRFILYSGCIILLFSSIIILRWKWMPTFIDIYYHLLAMINFKKYGGIAALSFWEYAPFGRPHLYPPLLHLAMLAVFNLYPNPLVVARVFEALSFPGVLLVIFFTISKVFNHRLAFWSVLLSASLYAFYLSCVDFLAASLAFCLGLLAFYSLERKRIIAGIVFLSLCLYSHVSISLFFALSLIIYGLLRPERRSPIIRTILFSFLIYLPLLIHQLRYLSYVDTSRIQEGFPFEINILTYSLAIAGLFKVVERKGRYLFFVALLLAGFIFSPLRYRFLSGQGMAGIIFLAALSLDYFYEKLYNAKVKPGQLRPSLIYLICAIFFILLISPSLTIQGKRVSFNLIGATYVHIFPSQEVRERPNEISIYLPKSFAPVFSLVGKETKPNDIIASNFEYLAGFVSVFTDRATSSAMLSEIRPFKEFDPFAYAKLIIWLKDPGNLNWQPQALIERLKLIKAGETEVFFIYKNPRAPSLSLKTPKAAVPFSMCMALLIMGLSLAVFDLVRRVRP